MMAKVTIKNCKLSTVYKNKCRIFPNPAFSFRKNLFFKTEKFFVKKVGCKYTYNFLTTLLLWITRKLIPLPFPSHSPPLEGQGWL